MDTFPGATLFDKGGLQAELEDPRSVHVDLLTPGGLPAAKVPRSIAGSSPPRMRATRLSDYFYHMQQTAIGACSFIECFGKDNLLADKRTQKAVIMFLKSVNKSKKINHYHKKHLDDDCLVGQYDVDIHVKILASLASLAIKTI